MVTCRYRPQLRIIITITITIESYTRRKNGYC